MSIEQRASPPRPLAAPAMAAVKASALRVAFWKKPLHFMADEAHGSREMERTLGLFDLIMLGIGGTVGSGVFATAGLIASAYAGPAATISWLIAGVGCLLSGLSFMELSCLIPSTGSTYAYAYHALGELPAMLAGFLLTLEYGISAAGGARSWSDKFTTWMDTELGVVGPSWMKPKDSSVDLYAGLLLMVITGIVLCGMQAGKLVVNVVTMTKISVVIFIIVVGLCRFDTDNVTPFIPDEKLNPMGEVAYGWPGVLLGASASFFGYIGYDEVCCLAGEAKNPTKNIPRAVIGTIIGAATLSTLATLSLVGMQRYTEIDAGESYGRAFSHVGWDWAATVVATGEVLTMPITTFIGFLAQPRVQYAMAKDGLLPHVFARVDSNGNLFHGTLLCGLAVTLIAVLVPFQVLWNFISLGILVAFNLTNSSLLLVRTSRSRPTASRPRSHGRLIAAFLLTSFFAAFHWQKSVIAIKPITDESTVFDRYMDTAGPFVAVFFSVVAFALMVMLKEAEDGVVAAASDLAASMAATNGAGDKKKMLQGVAPSDEVEVKDLDHLQRSHPPRRICRRGSEENLDVASTVEDTRPQSELSNLASDEASDNDQERVDVRADDVVSVDASETDDSSAVDEDEDDGKAMTFRAPLVPFTPCVAIFFNWFLFAQMDAASVALIALWLLLALALYFAYSRHRSLAHQQARYQRVGQRTPGLQV